MSQPKVKKYPISVKISENRVFFCPKNIAEIKKIPTFVIVTYRYCVAMFTCVSNDVI
jgi:hypothetical protein